MKKKVTLIVDIIVFLAATLAIACVFYEGMTLQWYDGVHYVILFMDLSFVFATIMHLIADWKDRMRIAQLFSAAMIIGAIVMKFMGMDYPAFAMAIWYMYIWFLYGVLIAKRVFGKEKEEKQPIEN